MKKCWMHLKNFAFHSIGDLPKLRVMGFALLLTVLVHGFLDTPFFKNDLALIFWVIVLVVTLPLNKEDS
jgi:hypothetical protein